MFKSAVGCSPAAPPDHTLSTVTDALFAALLNVQLALVADGFCCVPFATVAAAELPLNVQFVPAPETNPYVP